MIISMAQLTIEMLQCPWCNWKGEEGEVEILYGYIRKCPNCNDASPMKEVE